MAADTDGAGGADGADGGRGATPGAGPGPLTVPAPGSGGGRSTRRRIALVALVVLAALVVALVVWTDHEADGYYVYEPGTAPRLTTDAACRATSSDDLVLPDGTPCARLVVPAAHSHTIQGTLLMVDVLVGKATPVDYALHELGLLGHFHRGAQLYTDEQVLGTTPASQLACQDAQEMAGAQTYAPVAALRHLGYKIPADNLGAQVAEVIPGTAATQAGIKCNDLITGIDGHTVRTTADVAKLIGSRTPGTPITVTVRRTGTDGKEQTLTLHATLKGRPAITGVTTADPKDPFLGVSTQDDTTYHLPFPVSIQVGDIGGPSAGLALTLGLLDTISGGRLTGGHTIAATGTIDVDGAVGDVGGVKQKTVAVEKAGAQLFLVPPEEYAAAESEADGRMKIEKVTTLTQALADIEAVGGHVPAAG